MPILVIACMEIDERTGAASVVASHGIDLATDGPVVLPGEHPIVLGAHIDARLGEWIIPDDAPPTRAGRLK